MLDKLFKMKFKAKKTQLNKLITKQIKLKVQKLLNLNNKVNNNHNKIIIKLKIFKIMKKKVIIILIIPNKMKNNLNNKNKVK